MVDPTSAEKADRIVWGRALKALRVRSGKTLQEAAAAYRKFGQPKSEPPKGISVQRWQQAESGGIRFGEEQIERYCEALGASPEDLQVQRAKIMGQQPRQETPGFAERETRGLVIPIFGRPELGADGWQVRHAQYSDGNFDLRELMTPAIGVVRVADELMRGWADPGAPVIFDRSRRPLEGKGCVVETNDGDLYPRIFAGIDDEHVFVKTMASRKVIAFRRADVKGVYAVTFRGD